MNLVDTLSRPGPLACAGLLSFGLGAAIWLDVGRAANATNPPPVWLSMFAGLVCLGMAVHSLLVESDAVEEGP